MTPKENKLQASFRNFAKMSLKCAQSRCKKQIEFGLKHKSLTLKELEKFEEMMFICQDLLKTWKPSLKED